MKLLVIEDDKDVALLTQKGLSEIGAVVDVVSDGKEGLSRALNGGYNCIITDIMLPMLDGYSLVQELRKANNNTPVLILSALKDIDDRVKGLQLGGDDYLTKPFAIAELQMRVRALLRRSQQTSEITFLNFADLSLNRITRAVTRAGKEIELQEREFLLLDLFLNNPNKIINKSTILKHVWNYDYDPTTNIVDVLVCRLRNKLEKDFPSRLIFTVRGVGYVLKEG